MLIMALASGWAGEHLVDHHDGHASISISRVTAPRVPSASALVMILNEAPISLSRLDGHRLVRASSVARRLVQLARLHSSLGHRSPTDHEAALAV
ncbi:hypothetical protein [Micromonospora cremea]|uniref:hypothetical protein n=1 Tax=Micromonospora cremea TaxID=709881 RepID=UPI0013563400|nr:hypothetical protein [Micromonospora cremea]